MRFTLIILSCFWTAGFSSQHAQAQSQSFDGGTKVQWLPLLVRDLDRSLVLYRDILGFELADERAMNASAFIGQVFNVDPSRITRTAKLTGGANQPRIIALYEVTGLPPVDASGPLQAGHALQFDRHDEAYPALTNGEYRVLATKPWTEDGRGGEIAFVDHDGHLIIVYEIPEE